jgi:hypothetical protein
MLHGKRIGHYDRLVTVIYSPASRKGKRVGAKCPLNRDEIRAYVTIGAVAAVKLIRENRGCELREALALLNEARYGSHD